MPKQRSTFADTHNPAAPHAAMQALSERTDGPALIAVWGEETPGRHLSNSFPLGTRETDWHSHARGQLFCIASGLVHVRTRHGSWLLPPNRAGWVPPGEPHSASISGVMSGWNVFITPEASHHLPEKPCVIGVSELTWPLVRRVAMWRGQEQLLPDQRRMMGVLLDELRRAPHEPLHLPMPTERRLLRIARAILAQPDDRRTLAQWATCAGMSPRTLGRLFMDDVQISFAQWCQQARLVHALEKLARGEPVATVADALGYATPSNFIAMFRRSFGESPGKYFAAKA
jgi:AraC-like DNA-binding protein/mannose-6-phosphate isomerase-like protein (cupin superfamily)